MLKNSVQKKKKLFLTNKKKKACCPHLFTTVVFLLGWISAKGNFLILSQITAISKTNAKIQLKNISIILYFIIKIIFKQNISWTFYL